MSGVSTKGRLGSGHRAASGGGGFAVLAPKRRAQQSRAFRRRRAGQEDAQRKGLRIGARRPADGCPFVYAPADFLTLPTLEGIPQTISSTSGDATDTATLAQFAEALLAQGVVRYGDFTNSIPDTLEVGVCRWAGRHTGREGELKVLRWWHLVVSESVETLDSLYSAKSAKNELIERLAWSAPTMAAFTLEASSDRHVKLGDALGHLEECLRYLDVRPEPALRSVMGAINRTASLCGAWAPGSLRDQWIESDWGDEWEDENGEGALSKAEWEKIPKWLFSWKSSSSSLLRLARRLQPTETIFSGVYWIIYYAAQLALELDRWTKSLESNERGTDHLTYLEYPCCPSMILLWRRGDEVDALEHYTQYELECLWQAEYHSAQWLSVFDPCDPKSTRKAVATIEGLMRLIGKLDTLLEALDTFSRQLPTIPVQVKATPLVEVLAEATVHMAEARVRV